MAAVVALDRTPNSRGKQRVSQNAFRGGVRQTLRYLRRALREQKKALVS
jgi:hypothetical protein